METLTLDPRTIDLARRMQDAAREIEGREVDDDTAVRLARHVEGEWLTAGGY